MKTVVTLARWGRSVSKRAERIGSREVDDGAVALVVVLTAEPSHARRRCSGVFSERAAQIEDPAGTQPPRRGRHSPRQKKRGRPATGRARMAEGSNHPRRPRSTHLSRRV